MNIHTLIIIAANLLISMRGFRDYSFFEQYKFNVGALQRGETKRWISSGFLHVDWKHFAFNMITLYFFADIIIMELGVFNFYLIYLIGLLSGNLLSFYFNKNQPNYSAVGASGAVTGIVYAAILLNPGMSMYLYFIPIPIPFYVVGVGYLLFSIYGMKKSLGKAFSAIWRMGVEIMSLVLPMKGLLEGLLALAGTEGTSHYRISCVA